MLIRMSEINFGFKIAGFSCITGNFLLSIPFALFGYPFPAKYGVFIDLGSILIVISLIFILITSSKLLKEEALIQNL